MVSTAVRRHVFLAKQAARRPIEIREFRDLQRSHRLSADELTRLQEERALAMARHAFRNSPFYRDLYVRAGIDLRDLSHPRVLTELPIVTKADVRENADRIRSREAAPGDFRRTTTGGSSGRPMHVFQDRRVGEHAMGWSMRTTWGVDPSDSKARVWRARPQSNNAAVRRLRHLAAWPAARINLNTNAMDEAEIVRFLDEWDRVRPRLVLGYIGGLLEVARYLIDTGRHIAPPTAIEATAAPVTESDKALLLQAFGGPAFNVYGSNEVPVMAGECGRGNGLHVFSDIRRIEILDEAGRALPPDQTGTVVVTDLRNRAFPLIRYWHDDFSSWKVDGCGCALPFPVLNPIRGRLTDTLHFPSGLKIAGVGMAGIFEGCPHAIRQFQLVQHADLSLTLRCVPSDDPAAHRLIRDVVAGLEQTVRGEVPVRLALVDSIPHDRGKSRLILREGATPTLTVPQQATAPISTRR